MTNQNLYATVTDYKNYKKSRGGVADVVDAVDDVVIADLLEQASRYLDNQIAVHVFYPSYMTRVYDAQKGREIMLGKDLLELVTFTNGDGTVITSADYLLENPNRTPYYMVKMRDSSQITWQPNAYSSYEQAISIYGVWGWHQNYARAWKSGGTLASAINNTTGTSFVISTGHTLVPGMIIKIDTELFTVATTSTNAFTVNFRGDNGSTAATHTNLTNIMVWQTERLAAQAVLEIAHFAYERRFGKSVDNTVTVTEAGVVLSPRDIPVTAQKFIDSFWI